MRFTQISPLVAGSLLAAGSVAFAQNPTAVHLGISYNSASPPGIAVMPITGPNGDSIQAVLHRDLVNSDRFVVVPLDGSDPQAFRDTGPTGRLNYKFFAGLGVKIVVQVTEVLPDLHVVLHNVDSSLATDAKNYTLPAPALGRDWRMEVHIISDAIEEAATGTKGIAATRIAFTRSSTIHIIDSDGAFDMVEPSDSNASSPEWDPMGTHLAYSVYGKNSRIMGLEVATGKSRILVHPVKNQIMLGPRYAPNGASLIYWRTDGNETALWSVSADGGNDAKVASTTSWGNTSASFSPDGRRIAFMSGRSGRQQIYIMDADGTNAEMLTSGLPLDEDTYNADPDWSPTGLKIAFDSRVAGKAQIMTITVKDQSAKSHTNLGENEHPSWAPDGRHLVFTSDRGGTEELWVIDTESGNIRQVTHDAGSNTAAWSPHVQP